MIRKVHGDWEHGAVYIDGRLLSPSESLGVVNHSPTGFSWGYSGSGPAQLALALLMIVLPVEIAEAYHQQFKEDVIARMPQRDFDMPWDRVVAWILMNVPGGLRPADNFLHNPVREFCE